MTASPHDFVDLLAGDGVLVLSPQCTVLAATLQAERLLQQRLEPGQTLQLEDLFPEPHLSLIELAFQDALQTGTSRSNIPVLIRPDSDPALSRRCTVVPLNSPTREIIGVILTFQRRYPAQSAVRLLQFRPGGGLRGSL
ncbi:MAG: PAS domain-containing protein [Desulfobaccales bacterium]